jgi:APAF-1 helical domain
MSAPAPDIARLFASLQSVGCEVTAVELAEILWLARYVPPTRRSEIDSTSPLTLPPGSPHLPGAAAEADADANADADAARKPSVDAAATSSGPARDSHTADGLYARVERDPRLARGRRATIVRAPAAPALPNALALSRALRPLLKKRVSRHRWQLDEEATAEATALNHGIATPIFKPSAERWFEVALVVDGAPSMHVWHQAAGELRRLLIRHGGFRDLRQYRLRPAAGSPAGSAAGSAAGSGARAGAEPDAGPGAGPAPGPASGSTAGDVERERIELISESGRRLTPNAISDPSGHRLIVILSDVVSPMWRELPLRQALFAWSRWSPVVLLDVLPRRMWPHTPVGFAERTMAPRRAGAPNVEWMVERDWWDAEDGGGSITLPVITLDADHFGRWARALMQVSAERCTGTVLPLEAVPEASIAQPSASAASEEMPVRGQGPAPTPTSMSMPMSMPMSALERIQQFRSAASAPAYQLACYFAATLPVLPVLRIVQREMMPETGPGHLAEFLLGGLVRPRATGGGARPDDRAAEIESARHASSPHDSAGHDRARHEDARHDGARHDGARRVDPERTVYEFHPGVQELLLAQLDAGEVSRIMPAIESYLKTHLGESYDLIALVPDAHGAEQISAEALPFVKPAFDLMQRIIGRRPRAAAVSVYDRLVRILRHAFPERNVDSYVKDASWLPDDEVRTHLISAAIDLMSDEQRERLLPLAVTAHAPKLPRRLWASLFSRRMLEPLDRMDGVTWADDRSLSVTADVREGLRRHVTRARTPEMHRRIIEAYLGSNREPGTLDLPPFADTYFYHHILTHVAGANDDALARAIVSSAEWIEGKLRVCGVENLFSDLDRFSHVPAISELRAIAARRTKGQESTQYWAESLIEEWSSLFDTEMRVDAGASLEAAAELATDGADAPAANEATAGPGADTPPEVWVLVAGTGNRKLTDFEREITIALGGAMVVSRHALICGDWRGVDTLIAESYANALARHDKTPRGKLIRITSQNQTNYIAATGAEVVPYGSDAEYVEQALTRADVVVLIGGEGFTLELGHAAMTRFVPVVPIAATGGDAGRLFEELVREKRYRPDDSLNTPEGSDDRMRRVLVRTAMLVQDAAPRYQVLPLAETYLRTHDIELAERLEARLLTVLGRARDTGEVRAFPTRHPLQQCVRALAYRVKPDPAITKDLFEPDDSPHVMLQRVRACEVAFESRETRQRLPLDTEQRIERLDSVLDQMVDRRDGTLATIVLHAKAFMTARLRLFGRLATLAERAASPQFDDIETLRDIADIVVGQNMAFDCLTDLHPGWRLIGLAALTGRALHSPEPRADAASRILQATRFEATFHSHLELAVRAIDTMTTLSLPIELDASERATLEWMRKQVRPESRPALSARTRERGFSRLVERYHAIRRQPSSDARTGSMERIVSQMRRTVTKVDGFDVFARLDDDEPGWRLAAYAYVQQRPDAAFHVPLCRSLIKYRALPDSFDAESPDNRPFGEYQGVLALERVDEMLTELSKDQRIAWEAVRRSIHVDAARNRGQVLERIALRRSMPASLERADQVGDLLREEGHFNAALRAYREALAFVQERVEVYERTGERVEALRFAERALAIAQRLATLDQANPAWQTVASMRADVARLGGKQSSGVDEPRDE